MWQSQWSEEREKERERDNIHEVSKEWNVCGILLELETKWLARDFNERKQYPQVNYGVEALGGLDFFFLEFIFLYVYVLACPYVPWRPEEVSDPL